jgi:YD repeat-containing protein
VYWNRSGNTTAVWNNDGDTVNLYDAQDQLVAKYSYY